MHLTTAKTILSAKNGMNLYRGCTHGCIYCDSRSKCYGIDHDFEDVTVKSNAPALLEDALRRKRKPCMIGTGSMCDPYMPLEDTCRLTEQCLTIIERYGFGATLITKSAMVLRDLELLKSIHKKAKCVVQMTLTTYDEALCRIIEPNVSTTRERFEALCTLRDNGIPTVVWLCPILPMINDTEENLRGILSYCVEAKVKGIICFGMGVTLREGDREYFYQKLDEHFPGLKERYIAEYGNSYEVTSRNHPALMKLFYKECDAHGIMSDSRAVYEYLHTLEDPLENSQMSLF